MSDDDKIRMGGSRKNIFSKMSRTFKSQEKRPSPISDFENIVILLI